MYNDNVTFPNITTRHFINGDFLILTGIFNPILMIFDAVGNAIGYNFGDVSFAGMSAFCQTEMLGYFTEKNILLKLYTPFSMGFMILASYLVLRLSAVILNPVKGKEKKMVKKNGNRQKN